jgi:hypothetical protein
MFSDGSILEYSNHDNILEACPESCDVQKATLLPHWLQPVANATLFLDTVPRPRHGKLVLSDTDNWSFYPGNSTDPSRSIPLPDLTANIQDLLDKGHLFRGHAKFQRVYATGGQAQLYACVL